jgi:uncharacterized membrane protein
VVTLAQPTTPSLDRRARIIHGLVPDVRRRLPVGVGLGTFVLYAVASLVRFARMDAGIDLAIYTQAVQQYAHGHLPWSYLKGAWGFNLLGDHFTPVVALIAPFYRLFPDARTLLVAQAALIGLTAGILTSSASRTLGARTGAALGAGFVLAWGVQSMALFDFHEVAFALPLLAMAMSELLRGRDVRAVAWALPLVLVKEDSVFLLLGIALVLAARRRWWPATGLAGFALMTFASVVGVVIPKIGYYGTYTYWSASGTAGGLGGALDALWTAVSSGKAPILVAVLLAPSLGLALRSPIVLAALPPLLSRLTSPNQAYWGLDYHYNATITVVLAFAAIDAVRGLRNRGPRTALWVTRGAWAIAGLTLLVTVWLPLGTLAREAARPCPDCAAKALALARIPDGVSVAADDTLASYLVDRTFVHELKPDLRDTTGRPIYPEYIAMDRSLDGIWAKPPVLHDWREQLLDDGWGPIYHDIGEYVLAQDHGIHNTVVYDVVIMTTPYPSSPR